MRIRTFIIPTIFALISVFYFVALNYIPNGLFCDEAKIGLVAYHILHGNYTDLINPFFYYHFFYQVAALPPYMTMPFVALFGLSDVSVRLASAFFGVMTLVVFYYILKLLKARNSIVSVLLLAITPLYFHLSRIMFAQTPSVFLILLGYYLYILSEKKKQLRYAVATGVCFGLSMYGNSQFLIITPLILGCMILVEIARNQLEEPGYRRIGIAIDALLIVIFPLILGFYNNPSYFKRYNDRMGSEKKTLTQQIIRMEQNYPKYFSPDYLFFKGEIGMKGAFLTRHSITGLGLLSLVSLPIVIFAYLLLFYRVMRGKRTKSCYFLPFFILLPLYPLTDLVTTNSERAPYAVAVFPTLALSVAFVSAYALSAFPRSKQWGRIVVAAICIVIIIHWMALIHRYLEYPKTSSDTAGWPYGPHEIIDYFRAHHKEYVDLYMTASFDQPNIFFEFYDPHSECSNCYVGGVNMKQLGRRQLFAVRSSEMKSSVREHFVVRRILHLPDGKAEYYIGEISP